MTDFDKRRYGLITGSRCSVLFPKRSAAVGQRQYAKELANQMFFKYYDQVSSFATNHGNESEALGIEYYKLYFDLSIINGYFINDGFFGGTCDALCDSHGVDIKCPVSLQNWLDAIHEDINPVYYHQAQMYMYLFGKEKWVVAYYLIETDWMSNNGETYPVPHDKRMILKEVYPEEGWVEKLHERGADIIKMRDDFLRVLISNFK